MKELGRKKYVLIALGSLAILGLGFQALPESDTGSNSSSADWKQIQLKDVSTGETFTVAELEKPVLVESFAVWCPTCTRQQQELKKLHSGTDVRSVSIDVDPNEDASKVRQHVNRHGFDWRYAIAPSEMTRQLVEEYGNSIAHPPSAPAVLVCENGTRKLPNGVKPVSKLKEEIEKGC